MTTAPPKPLTPAQRKRRAKDLLKRHDELRYEAFDLMREIGLTDPEISNALYESRSGFWLLWRKMEDTC